MPGEQKITEENAVGSFVIIPSFEATVSFSHWFIKWKLETIRPFAQRERFDLSTKLSILMSRRFVNSLLKPPERLSKATKCRRIHPFGVP